MATYTLQKHQRTAADPRPSSQEQQEQLVEGLMWMTTPIENMKTPMLSHLSPEELAEKRRQERFDENAVIYGIPAGVAFVLIVIARCVAGWVGALVTAAAMLVVGCMIIDSLSHNYGGDGGFWVVVCRIVGSHAKLLFKVALGVFLYFGVLLGGTQLLKPQAKSNSSGGPQSEELAGFFNTILFFPRMLLDGLVGLGRVIMFVVMLLMVWLTEFLINHWTAFFYTLAVLYLYWSVCKIRQIVWEEYSECDDRAAAVIGTSFAWMPFAACVLYGLVVLAAAGHGAHIEYAKLW